MIDWESTTAQALHHVILIKGLKRHRAVFKLDLDPHIEKQKGSESAKKECGSTLLW